MILRGINFGHILGASGAQGFIGDGSEYTHHRIPFLRPNFTGMTFVAKTVTLNKRKTENGANMDIDSKTLRPKELFPKCIAINWARRAVANAVGLTNTGIEEMLARDCWQERTSPFFISFMAVSKTAKGRLSEWKEFCHILKMSISKFNTPFGIQINFSCPNAGIDTKKLPLEVKSQLSAGREILGEKMVFMPKFSVTQIPIAVAVEISRDENCDAICVSNTIPWKDLPDEIKMDSFGSLESPLITRGFEQEGGYSGPYLFPLVHDWVKEAMEVGVEKPINAGGGIFSRRDVFDLYLVGVSSVFLGGVALLRPWKVQKIIRYSTQLFEGRNK
ncbi:hypothetical protein MNBD_BACTEROID05-657 [hydrothermal vent metagenome]|uniref:Dihydroorotate dehydrogenase catalytic domain-containing protein n=1 Tax=hydrothermal vent metagenome TaxID=652676 RepID=A0A3B0T673_9ZZZZ